MRYVLILFLSLVSLNAHAWSLSAVGSLTVPNGWVNSDLAQTEALPSSYGGGVLFNYNLIRPVSLEIGFLYGTRGFVQTTETETTSFRFKALQVPILARVNILSNLSLGLGGYLSHGFGTLKLGENTLSSQDAGVVMSVALTFKLFPGIKLLIDGRYLYGLSNLSNVEGEQIDLNDIQLLTGIRFGI